MEASKLSKEWADLNKKTDLALTPTTVAQYVALKRSRGLHGQKFLNEDAFRSLSENVTVFDTKITLPEVTNHKFDVRIYRPSSTPKEKLPILLYFHGGYWCAGDANSEDLGCRAIIARGNNIAIISFSYRLVPDVPWHVQFNDAEFAMKYVATNASDFHGDISRGFLIGGADAGAHLAALCTIRAKQRYPNIHLTGQVLIVPTLVAVPDNRLPDAWSRILDSHTQNAHAPVLSEELFQLLLRNLDIPTEDARDRANFPMWAAMEDGGLRGLPPAYLAMDECDPTRDHGFVYARLLAEAGVKTRMDFYEGLPNMFVQFPELDMTAVAGGHLAAGVKWLLQVGAGWG